MGIVAALLAFLGWGFGDFAIQRTIRRVGSIGALFCIGAFGAIILLPFAWHAIPAVLSNPKTLLLIGTTLAVTLAAALFEFRALREGKLAVIEPVLSFELLVTAAISILFVGERISPWQAILAGMVFLGILLTVIKHEPRHWWKFWQRRSILEHGVIAGAFGAIMMALTNVYTGLASQATNPLITIWFIHTSLALICLCWFLATRQLRNVTQRIYHAWRPALAESILDNLAWVSYATAVQTIPIAVTIAITESYVVLTSLLGIMWNKERLQRHQFVGVTVTLAAAITLAILST